MELTYLAAGLVTFGFTTILSVVGLGGAFILIPVYLVLGIDLHTAMATALLLNAVAMAFACLRYVPAGLVEFRTALPVLVAASILSPIGAYTSKFLPIPTLKWLLVGFLFFAATMMLFYKARKKETHPSSTKLTAYGLAVGTGAGYFGGLLGVGGGNFIIPALVGLGLDPKKASGTTAFIVIFASLSGFFGKASIGGLDKALLLYTVFGSIGGALLGSWLMHKKLETGQVKKLIAIVLYVIATQMSYKLLAG